MRGILSVVRLAGAPAELLAPALVLRHLDADVLLGALRSAACAPARVLCLEHLVDVVELQLGFDLGRTGGAPIHLLRTRARIPLAERQQDPDGDDEAEQHEQAELVDLASVRSEAMSEAVILDALRTPIGRHGGVLATVRPDDLAAHVVRAAVERNALDPDSIDEIYMGCANQAGEDNRNVARMAGLLAGLPVGVPGVTVNRLCASGLEAAIQGSRQLKVGEADLVLAGGVESMTRSPWVMRKPEQGFTRGNAELADTTLGWRLVNPRMEE